MSKSEGDIVVIKKDTDLLCAYMPVEIFTHKFLVLKEECLH